MNTAGDEVFFPARKQIPLPWYLSPSSLSKGAPSNETEWWEEVGTPVSKRRKCHSFGHQNCSVQVFPVFVISPRAKKANKPPQIDACRKFTWVKYHMYLCPLLISGRECLLTSGSLRDDPEVWANSVHLSPWLSDGECNTPRQPWQRCPLVPRDRRTTASFRWKSKSRIEKWRHFWPCHNRHIHLGNKHQWFLLGPESRAFIIDNTEQERQQGGGVLAVVHCGGVVHWGGRSGACPPAEMPDNTTTCARRMRWFLQRIAGTNSIKLSACVVSRHVPNGTLYLNVSLIYVSDVLLQSLTKVLICFHCIEAFKSRHQFTDQQGIKISSFWNDTATMEAHIHGSHTHFCTPFTLHKHEHNLPAPMSNMEVTLTKMDSCSLRKSFTNSAYLGCPFPELIQAFQHSSCLCVLFWERTRCCMKEPCTEVVQNLGRRCHVHQNKPNGWWGLYSHQLLYPAYHSRSEDASS